MDIYYLSGCLQYSQVTNLPACRYEIFISYRHLPTSRWQSRLRQAGNDKVLTL